MNNRDLVTLKDYIDLRVNNVDRNITDLRQYIEQHFDLNDKALKLANDALSVRFKEISQECNGVSKRVGILETARAFTAGKMWMVMALFAAIPTVLALIALFKG